MKKKTAILLILIAAFFLRLYHLNINFAFSGEFGDNYLHILSAVQTRIIPTLGPPTSHPWLYFSPLYYWIMIPVFSFTNGNPLAGAYVGVFIGILALIANYLLLSKIDRKVAIISSTLIAFSPLWIEFSRAGRFFFFVTPISCFFYYFLYKFVQNKKDKYLTWSSLSLGFMLSFHYSPIPLILIVFLAIYLKLGFRLSKFIKVIFYTVLPLSPLIIKDMLDGFPMLSKFAVWGPYRLLGFLGLYPKNNFSVVQTSQDVGTFVDFIGKSFVVNQKYYLIVFLIFFFCLYSARKQILSNAFYSLLFISFMLMIAVSLIHGDAPVHYYLPVFLAPVILVSVGISKWSKTAFYKGVLVGIALTLLLLNFKAMKASSRYYSLSFERNYVNYVEQLRAVQAIVQDNSQNLPFSIHRVGKDDQFEGDFAQNYMYLLKWKHMNLVEESDLSYTIYDDIYRYYKQPNEIYNDYQIAITKKHEK